MSLLRRSLIAALLLVVVVPFVGAQSRRPITFEELRIEKARKPHLRKAETSAD